ncbi:hypothetical protein [Rhodoferax sp.]|uniref:hypothetical protein n=1 Tax=Rhodoferax sp. TaxID=50421 RepID=UPI0026239156|nr:hypothetical protein [Rhodoferax sp.]
MAKFVTGFTARCLSMAIQLQVEIAAVKRQLRRAQVAFDQNSRVSPPPEPSGERPELSYVEKWDLHKVAFKRIIEHGNHPVHERGWFGPID